MSSFFTGGGTSSATTKTITQAHTFTVGQWLYLNGSVYALTDSDVSTSTDSVGVVSAVTDANNFTLTTEGLVTGLSGLTAGSVYYLSGTPGAITTTVGTKHVLIADSTTSGYVQQYLGSSQALVSGFAYLRSTTNTGSSVLSDSVGTGNITYATPIPQAKRINYISGSGANGRGLNASGLFTTTGTLVPDTTTGEITIPTTGTYSFNLSFNSETQTGNQIHTQLVLNGTSVLASSAGVGEARTNGYDVNYTGPFVAGDKVDFRADVSNGASFLLHTINWSAQQLPTAVAPVVNTVAEYGENTGITDNQTVTTSLADVAGSSFTLPTAGTWEVDYIVYSNLNSGTAVLNFNVLMTDTSNVAVSNSNSYVSYDASNTGCGGVNTQKVFITTTGATTYKLRAITTATQATINNTNSTGSGTGSSKVTYRKISGFLPSSGQTVDYVNVYRDATSYNTTANAAYIFDTVSSGNIPYNTSTGQFTLTAGKTYLLEGSIQNTQTSNSVQFQWYDITSAALIGSPGISVSFNTGFTTSDQKKAVTIFTPSVNTTVELRTTTARTTNSIARLSYATIVQLGSSNVIAGLYPGTWGTYTPTITAVTTNPVKPTTGIVIDTARYIVEGKKLTVIYTYWNGTITGGSNGSGAYKFSLPGGYTIDTTAVTTIASVDPTLASPNIANIIGSAQINRGTQSALSSRFIGSVYAADANTVTASFIGSTAGLHQMYTSAPADAGIAQSNIGWAMQFTVPIV